MKIRFKSAEALCIYASMADGMAEVQRDNDDKAAALALKRIGIACDVPPTWTFPLCVTLADALRDAAQAVLDNCLDNASDDDESTLNITHVDLLPTTVRFWTWECGGWVKLTVREDKPIRWHTWGRTDEGYSSQGWTIRLEDGVVYQDEWSDGRDCDGRMSSQSLFMCPVESLGGYISPMEGSMPSPCWERVQAGQRDYSAEAAGY